MKLWLSRSFPERFPDSWVVWRGLELRDRAAGFLPSPPPRATGGSLLGGRGKVCSLPGNDHFFFFSRKCTWFQQLPLVATAWWQLGGSGSGVVLTGLQAARLDGAAEPGRVTLVLLRPLPLTPPCWSDPACFVLYPSYSTALSRRRWSSQGFLLGVF